MAKVRSSFAEQGLEIKSAELTWRPIVINSMLDKNGAIKTLDFVEKLENLDDVHRVYANFDISDEIMQSH